MPVPVIVLLIIFAALLVFVVIPLVFVLPAILYVTLLVRTSKKKWTRCCPMPEDKEYKGMFDEGLKWDAENSAYKTPVDIYSSKYHLFGEYFDFGSDKAVIIIAGRMESLLYSYYFAQPYQKLGFNVLVIDNRSHGESDGRVHSLGFREYEDILNWGRFLHDQKRNKTVVLHGICIGSSAALFALTDEKCPDYMRAMVAEGMYTTFCDSFINHMKDGGHRVYPTTTIMMLYIRLFSRADVVHDGPLYRIDKLKKPILFIHSKEDVFSLAKECEAVYNKCSSKKKIAWFDKGAHSRVRVNNVEGYDKAIADFYNELGY